MSTEARLQRRIQRYGWDLAAERYGHLWEASLSPAHRLLFELAPPAPGDAVLDVASGTGLVALMAAAEVGAGGRVAGVDISARMVEMSTHRAAAAGLGQIEFKRMDGEGLAWPDDSFDLVYCALGLMYMPGPEQALREMHRVLRPGGRMAVAVWGERANCGWSAVFPIVDAEVASEVCPLFFQLGQPGALSQLAAAAGFDDCSEHRISAGLRYRDAQEACDAAFIGGPVALAWSRFDDDARARVQQRYLSEIARWEHEGAYEVPGEFVVLRAQKA